MFLLTSRDIRDGANVLVKSKINPDAAKTAPRPAAVPRLNINVTVKYADVIADAASIVVQKARIPVLFIVVIIRILMGLGLIATPFWCQP
ncbi:hypothetical protein EHJ37_19745 [Vibrio parahaemolyticus]|nr:hypothetical protein [Vibrio parahaemolyticus]